MELPAKLPFSKRRLRPRVIISYIFDYVILIACVIGFWILDSVEPYHQHFALQNYTLQYPYAVHERIPIAYALCISGAFPLALIIIYTLFIDGLFSHNKPQNPVSGKRSLRGPWRWKDRLWEMNCGILGLLLAQGVNFVITQALKTACGKPRPDLIDRCQPRAGSVDPKVYGLSDSSICTGDPAIIKDGFRSWPSGHSSSSFAGLFYLSLWLGGKLHIMDSRGEAWKPLICMTPILAAALVAVSRIMDARHHPFDVITGSLLGTLCAFMAYRQYFPSLSESWRKGRAYPIRTWGTEPAHPMDPLGVKLLSSQDSTAALNHPEIQRLSPANENENENQGQRATSPLNRLAPAPSVYSNTGNPFAAQPYPRRRHDHHPDGNWSSSEEDVADGYEMQHGYAMSQAPPVDRYYPPQYESGTAYMSQTAGSGAGAGAGGGVGMATTTGPNAPLAASGYAGHQGRQLTDAPV